MPFSLGPLELIIAVIGIAVVGGAVLAVYLMFFRSPPRVSAGRRGENMYYNPEDIPPARIIPPSGEYQYPPQQPYASPAGVNQAQQQEDYMSPQQPPYGAPQQPYGAPQQPPYGAPQQPYAQPYYTPPPQQPYPGRGYQPAIDGHCTTKDWILTLFLTSLPLVGLIMLFVWAFGGNQDCRSRFSKAYLIWQLILIGIGVLCFIFLALLARC